MDVSIRGAEQFEQLSDRVKKHADAKALRKELYRGLNRATKETRADMKREVPQSLPRGGGLAARVGKAARFNTKASRGGATVGVRIVGAGKAQLANYNAGRFRHPVFGRKAFVTQTAGVRAGFLDRVFEGNRDDVRRRVLDVMDDVARKVEG